MADEADQAPQKLLTPSEVAPLLRVSAPTVVKWAAAGRIGATRTPTGRWLIDGDEARRLATPVREAA